MFDLNRKNKTLTTIIENMIITIVKSPESFSVFIIYEQSKHIVSIL